MPYRSSPGSGILFYSGVCVGRGEGVPVKIWPLLKGKIKIPLSWLTLVSGSYLVFGYNEGPIAKASAEEGAAAR